jgi:hypothetical protein
MNLLILLDIQRDSLQRFKAWSKVLTLNDWLWTCAYSGEGNATQMLHCPSLALRQWPREFIMHFFCFQALSAPCFHSAAHIFSMGTQVSPPFFSLPEKWLLSHIICTTSTRERSSDIAYKSQETGRYTVCLAWVLMHAQTHASFWYVSSCHI